MSRKFGWPNKLSWLEIESKCPDSDFFTKFAKSLVDSILDSLDDSFDWNKLMRIQSIEEDMGLQRPFWKKVSDKTNVGLSDLFLCSALLCVRNACEEYNKIDLPSMKQFGLRSVYGAAWAWLCRAHLFVGYAAEDTGNEVFIVPESLRRVITEAPRGPRNAQQNRAPIRDQVSSKVKEIISKRKLWDDWKNDLGSITSSIHKEITSAIETDGSWQGFSADQLKRGRIGRRTIYDAVRKTDPRLS